MSQITSTGAAADRSLATSSFFGPTPHPAGARLIGGPRGKVDGALPPALFAGSVAVGRPLAGVVYAALFQTGPAWRHDRRLCLRGCVPGLVGGVRPQGRH